MRSFQPKRKWGRILESTPVLIFLGILLLLFAWNVLRFMGKMRDTIKNKKIAEAKVEDLEKSKLKLTADISKLESKDGVEETIRDKFGLAKEGEGLILVVEEKAVAVPEEAPKRGFFSFFTNLFK